MPNRYIRDGILNSERYLSCTQLERLLFIEMILIADDFGLLKINFVPLRRRVTACEGITEEAVLRMVSHLNDAGLIHIYEHDGNRYAYIPDNGFQVRAFKPKCPLPEQRDGSGFNEIKALAEKRSSVAKHMRADAAQVRSSRSTTSTSTSTYISKPLSESRPDARVRARSERKMKGGKFSPAEHVGRELREMERSVAAPAMGDALASQDAGDVRGALRLPVPGRGKPD